MRGGRSCIHSSIVSFGSSNPGHHRGGEVFFQREIAVFYCPYHGELAVASVSQLPVCKSPAHNPERCVVMARATFTGKTTMELAMKELKLQPIRLKSRCLSNTKAKRET